MSTFSEMRAKIEDDLNRTDLTTQVNREINRAIRKYAKQKFWFAATTGTFSTVADQQSYGTGDGLPSDIRDIIYLRITQSSSVYYELIERGIDRVLRWNSNDDSGLPTDYAWLESKIYLYPNPDAVYTVTVYYQKYYTDLSADGDSNDFTTNPEAEQLIENEAKYHLYAELITDAEQALICRGLRDEALKTLKQINSDFIGVHGSIRPTQW